MAESCCGDNSAAVRKVKKACCSGPDSIANPDEANSACRPDQQEQDIETGDILPNPLRLEADWITGYIQTPVGEVPIVSTKLTFKDTFGSWKCRWSIGRMDYKVEPGLYAVGTPDSTSPVLVTANYKMTFDRLRQQLSCLNLWIVVLDTDGVNVWCAAGKGTFGTEELVTRLAAVRLSAIVSHRTLILPQLGAVGVAAHEVTKQTGFRIVYGTVRAKDIKAFLANGMKATEDMRTVKFTLADRIVLTPMEFVVTLKPMLITFGVLFILNAIGFGHYGWPDLYGLIGAIFVGVFLTPILLPWVPGRAFAFKGGLLGFLWALGFLLLNGVPAAPAFGWLKAAAYLLLLPSISGFCTMNFTGASTYTSLSGVDKEMKIGLPIMIFGTAGAVLFLLISDFIQLFGGVLI